MGTFLISRSPLETTAKKYRKIIANEFLNFSVGASFYMAFLRFFYFYNHFFKFISMPIKYTAIVVLGQKPSNPHEHPGDS